MDIAKLSVGPNPPWDVHAIIEIPQGSTEPVKYEFDKASGALMVDRFLHTAMFYPANYGFIPHSLSDDGDPIDVLVVSRSPVVSGAVIRSRPIGALRLSDEKGLDEKIVAVPVDDLHPYYEKVASYRDLPPILCDQITHFFEHYKDLERGKWVAVSEWVDAEDAAQLIVEALDRYSAQSEARDRRRTSPPIGEDL